MSSTCAPTLYIARALQMGNVYSEGYQIAFDDRRELIERVLVVALTALTLCASAYEIYCWTTPMGFTQTFGLKCLATVIDCTRAEILARNFKEFGPMMFVDPIITMAFRALDIGVFCRDYFNECMDYYQLIYNRLRYIFC